jgi:RNA polymerase primary sigma factor
MNRKFIDTNEDALKYYLKEVRKYKPLTPKQEIEVAKRIKEGDQGAITELCNANLRFVISVAKEYQHQGVPLADLINEGNYGLVVAAIRFEWDKGNKFISYAIWWIKQSILQSLNEHARIVRLPVNIISKLKQIKKEIEKFEKKFERDPSDTEVDYIHVPSCVSLNTPVNEDGGELLDIIPCDMYESPDQVKDATYSVKQRLDIAMSSLSEREKEIVNCYFGITGEPMTLESIGDEIGLTKERVRQIKEKAIRKIRNNVGDMFEGM